MKHLLSLFAIGVLLVPPMPAQGKSIMVGVCGEDGLRIAIPVKAPAPEQGGDHSCCPKGCHAASDRRKRLGGMMDDDSCC